MQVRIEPSWKRELAPVFEAPYFAELADFVRAEYKTQVCYPPANRIFAAFDHCPFDAVRVVIIGQDPYHEAGQAMGLSFSVPDGQPLPPSLRNIYREIETDLGITSPASGNLTRWADQGVLLLNATLTVRAHVAGSHQRRGWETFTDTVISTLNARREGLVFMLWGGYARSKSRLIDPHRHLVLEAAHPSPLSANRGGWFGCRHFSAANTYLFRQGVKPIEW